MDEGSARHEEAIFDAAVQIRDRAEREAYVATACADDEQLLASVQALLQYHDSGSFLDAPAMEAEIRLRESGSVQGPGTVIGRYKLLERIGEGGMAVVYMAEQEQPIRRKVALKIIKLGMDTKQVIARFEAERQALAMMDHPNIAKVLDAGATEAGRPYFVMELVTGVSITEYCDQNNLSTRERLDLFVQVCRAVQHAHQRGIIHRDIKPSNVMVTQRDGTPVPKVIDFGIAKATNQRLTEKTLFTRYAHIIGTPAYMSPEQAELSDLDVDTRTDVYSLGVLLYELLTGDTPFSEEELRKAGYLEMQRMIREEEPAKPSTKLSTLGQTLSDVAKRRSCNPDALTRAVRGDLDWIVMKTLEKNRNRRYDTASALALDIQHCLAQEPVSARKPHFSYILGKYLCKHRFKLSASAIVIVLLLAVVIISLMWNHNRTRLSRVAEVTERAILFQAREALAERDLSTALKHTRSILNSDHVGPEARLLHAGILVEGRQSEEAVSKLQDLLTENPKIAGAAHALLARVYWEGDFEESEKLAKVNGHRQKAEELLPDTAEANLLRAMTALTIRQKLEFLNDALRLDPGHYESRRMRAYIYQASRKYGELEHDALVMIALRPGRAMGYRLCALARHRLGDYQQALEHYDSVLRLHPPASPAYADLCARRCEVLMDMGAFARVLTDTDDALRNATDTARICFHRYCALTALGRYAEAEALFQAATEADPSYPGKVEDWSVRYVFDRLDRGLSWHPPVSEPQGSAFSALFDAEHTYRNLSLKARRLLTDAFTARSSPDGTKLAFSTGYHGYSGVALYHMDTKETELLIAPGKDPAWSPDGRTIAFVRDCQIMPISELIGAEQEGRHRPPENQEIWIMNADGTEPRRVALGCWPQWSHDSNRLYYHSRAENTLYAISVRSRGAAPQPLLNDCPKLPAVSPDETQVAYVDQKTLKIVDLNTQTVIDEWDSSFLMYSIVWLANGRELCLGLRDYGAVGSGLWAYELDEKRAQEVLRGPVSPWTIAPDQSRLLLNLSGPCSEIWVTNLDPNLSLVQSLGPGKTMVEHNWDIVDYYSQRISRDPENAKHYYLRAKRYDRLNEQERARLDLVRYTTYVSGSHEVSGIRFGQPKNLGPAVNSAAEEGHPLPVADELSFIFYRRNLEGTLEYWLTTRATRDDPWRTAERITATTHAWSIPGVTTADGLECYVRRWPGAYGSSDICVMTRSSSNAHWSDPINLGPIVNNAATEMSPAVSPDGLELYFSGYNHMNMRLNGQGESDLWVTTRASRDAPWSEPVNLGSKVNSPYNDCRPSLSIDGLLLFFDSARPAGPGGFDLWMMRRASLDAPWQAPVNLGPGVNSPDAEYYPHLSADGSTLYYVSRRLDGFGDTDIWQVPVHIPGYGQGMDSQ